MEPTSTLALRVCPCAGIAFGETTLNHRFSISVHTIEKCTPLVWIYARQIFWIYARQTKWGCSFPKAGLARLAYSLDTRLAAAGTCIASKNYAKNN